MAALKVSPKARATLRKAHTRFGNGDQAGAIALLHEAVQLSPSFTEAWNELGTVAYKARRYVEAADYFRTALEHEPLAYAPMVNLGGTLLSQGHYDEALNFNLMAHSMRPADALANSQLGMNFFYKGQLPKAREFLLRAKEADLSHFSYPQLFLAEIYAKQGQIGRRPQRDRGDTAPASRLGLSQPSPRTRFGNSMPRPRPRDSRSADDFGPEFSRPILLLAPADHLAGNPRDPSAQFQLPTLRHHAGTRPELLFMSFEIT